MKNNFYLNVIDEQQKRERLQNLFDISFQKNDKSSLRQSYKELRRLELNSGLNQPCETVNVSELTENITMACDVLTSDIGINFLYCGNETHSVLCNCRLFTKALLNLLSNAYLYGQDRIVLVKTIECGNFVKIEVQSGGKFEFDRENKGLSFVRSFCQSFQGRFLIESDVLYSKAMMILPKSKGKGSQSVDFCDLISDRLSPVYVEFFGMEYN